MDIKKTWRLTKNLTGHDIEWLKSSGLVVEVVPEEIMDISSMTGTAGSILKMPPIVSVVTEDEKQEMLFLLMYGGNESYLFSSEYKFI